MPSTTQGMFVVALVVLLAVACTASDADSPIRPPAATPTTPTPDSDDVAHEHSCFPLFNSVEVYTHDHSQQGRFTRAPSGLLDCWGQCDRGPGADYHGCTQHVRNPDLDFPHEPLAYGEIVAPAVLPLPILESH